MVEEEGRQDGRRGGIKEAEGGWLGEEKDHVPKYFLNKQITLHSNEFHYYQGSTGFSENVAKMYEKNVLKELIAERKEEK